VTEATTRKLSSILVRIIAEVQYSPPLRTAPVFGGITGIMSQEVAEVAEEGSNIPSLSNKSRENGELQDMYRRTLAASWVAQPGVIFILLCPSRIAADLLLGATSRRLYQGYICWW